MEANQNPVVIKILNGTQNSQVDLCEGCRFCVVRRAARSGWESKICEFNYQHPLHLREPISHCNRYISANHPTLHEMSEIAWQLMTNQRKVVGFLSPDELKERNGSVPPSSPSIGFR